MMTQFYGNYTAEVTIRSIVGPFQTGDLHAAVYDFGANTL